MDQSLIQDIYQKRCLLAMTAPKKNGFKAIYSENKKEAREEVLAMIPERTKIGIGGSVTIREIGLEKALEEKGNVIYSDWGESRTIEEKLSIRKAALNSAVFLTSSNAITLNGQIVNIDETGNRVSAMIFGPGKIIIVAGANKIVDTLDDAQSRIRNIAAPFNGRRLHLNTPCAVSGKCNDCDSPQRMCKVTVIMDRKPNLSDITVLLVGEQLGF